MDVLTVLILYNLTILMTAFVIAINESLDADFRGINDENLRRLDQINDEYAYELDKAFRGQRPTTKWLDTSTM